MKKVLLFIILTVIIGFIFYFWKENQEYNIPPHVDEQYHWTISFQFSEQNIRQINFGSPGTRLNLARLTKLISQQENWEYKFDDYGDMGIIVTQIHDKQNGQDQKYWQYFVNGQQPQISADKYFPENNAHIEWKFIKSEF